MNRNKLNDYDVAGWHDYYLQHPGFHRSVGPDAAGDGDGDDAGKGGDGEGSGSGDGDGDGNGSSDNWRDAYGIEDANEKIEVERFVAPSDLWKAYKAGQERISSGELLKPLAADHNEDDLKVFRVQQNVPLDPKLYLEDIPDGLVIGKEDQPAMLSFASYMHEANLTPTQMHRAFGWYNAAHEEADAARQEGDEKLKQETEDIMRAEWSTEYRKNNNLIDSLLQSQFGKAEDLFKNARDESGNKLMESPDIIRGMAALSRIWNPAGALVPNLTDPNASLDDEIKAIEAKMGTKEYIDDNAMQERYRNLVDARINRDKRGKAA